MKPTIQKISPFDANNAYSVNIIWTGSSFIGHNEIIVSEADTLNIVYEKKLETHKLSHEIPAGTLGNGKQYVIQCYVYYEESGVEKKSDISDKVQFRTFTTPSFVATIQDLNDKGEVTTASATVKVMYSQSEGELLSFYRFYLYEGDTIKDDTSVIYDVEDIVYSFSGLDTNTEYQVQCIGSTVNGMEVKTELLTFVVNYQNPDDYAKFIVEPEPDKGWNAWNTNIVIVSYRGNEKFTYLPDEDDNPQFIDLTDKSVYYGNDGSISIPNDCTIIIEGKGFTSDVIFDCYDSLTFEHLTISSYIYDDAYIKFKLTANNGLNDYIIYSNTLDLNLFDDEPELVVEVKKKENLYNLKLYVRKEE